MLMRNIHDDEDDDVDEGNDDFSNIWRWLRWWCWWYRSFQGVVVSPKWLLPRKWLDGRSLFRDGDHSHHPSHHFYNSYKFLASRSSLLYYYPPVALEQVSHGDLESIDRLTTGFHRLEDEGTLREVDNIFIDMSAKYKNVCRSILGGQNWRLMHVRRKISRTGEILPMGKISLTCFHAFSFLQREPGFNKEDHSFFRQAWFSSYFNVHRWSFRFKKDFIFKSPLQCNKPAPEVLVSKLSVEYFHMDVSERPIIPITTKIST